MITLSRGAGLVYNSTVNRSSLVSSAVCIHAGQVTQEFFVRASLHQRCEDLRNVGPLSSRSSVNREVDWS